MFSPAFFDGLAVGYASAVAIVVAINLWDYLKLFLSDEDSV